MDVKLSEDLQAFVDQKLASGQYASADEIIETALLELRNIETGELDARWLRAKIDSARASLDAGDGLPADQAIEKIRRLTGTTSVKVRP